MMPGGTKDYDNEQLLHQMLPAVLVLPHPNFRCSHSMSFVLLKKYTLKNYCHTYLKKKSLQSELSCWA